MNHLIVTGVVLAIGYGLMPGPVNAETTRRGLQDGFGPALGVQLGALAGDAPWAVICLTGVGLLLHGRLLSTVLGLAGGCFLFMLARSAFRAALGREPALTMERGGSSWRVGFVLSVANPGAIAFWTGGGGGALAVGQTNGTAGVWVLVTSYTVASVLTGIVLAGVATLGQRWARGAWRRWVDGLCGVALAWTGAALLWGTIG